MTVQDKRGNNLFTILLGIIASILMVASILMQNETDDFNRFVGIVIGVIVIVPLFITMIVIAIQDASKKDTKISKYSAFAVNFFFTIMPVIYIKDGGIFHNFLIQVFYIFIVSISGYVLLKKVDIKKVHDLSLLKFFNLVMATVITISGLLIESHKESLPFSIDTNGQFLIVFLVPLLILQAIYEYFEYLRNSTKKSKKRL